jgi:parallel beta-helix repeat protein
MMTTRPTAAATALVAIVAAAALVTAGPLDPPAGPIGPTYKTLSDVEPRTPVNAANTPGDDDASPSLFRISQPGSYYLTGNLTGVAGKSGIEIAASDVTLDLNGFALQGVPGSLNGIVAAPGANAIAVRNGVVRGWGGPGVVLGAADPRIEQVTAINNGGIGIYAGLDAVLTNCVARGNAGIGLSASRGTITGCVASHNTGHGIYGTDGASVSRCSATNNNEGGIFINGTASISECTATGNGEGGFACGYGSSYAGCAARENDAYGFWVNSGSTATNCSSYDNGTDGFIVYIGSVVNCTATFNSRDGIRLDTSDCTATGNTCRGNGTQVAGAGIRALGTACRIDSNQVSANGFGIVSVSDCVVVRNTARANSSGNYSFAAGTEYGQIITNPGSGFVSSNPWANFAY